MTKHQTFPFDELLRIAKNLTAEFGRQPTDKELRETAWIEFSLTGKHARALFDYWFDHNAHRIEYEPENDGNGPVVTPKPARLNPVTRPPKSDEQKKDDEDKIAETVQKLKTLVLMDLIMPNGKRLRECTGSELVGFGGWLADVGKIVLKKGTRTKAGTAATEKDIQAVLKRYAKKK